MGNETNKVHCLVCNICCQGKEKHIEYHLREAKKDFKEMNFVLEDQRNIVGRNISRDIYNVCRARDETQRLNPWRSFTKVSPEKQIPLKAFAEHLISDLKIKERLWRSGFVIKIDYMTKVKKSLSLNTSLNELMFLKVLQAILGKISPTCRHINLILCIFSKSTEGFGAFLKKSFTHTKLWIFI